MIGLSLETARFVLTKAYERYLQAIERTLLAVRPGIFKLNTRNGGQQVDPVGLRAQLDNLVGSSEVRSR